MSRIRSIEVRNQQIVFTGQAGERVEFSKDKFFLMPPPKDDGDDVVFDTGNGTELRMLKAVYRHVIQANRELRDITITYVSGCDTCGGSKSK